MGVPLISPEEVLKFKPAGNAGAITQEFTIPPLIVGVIVEIAEPLVKTNVLIL